MTERPPKCRTAEIAWTISELHALPPKLVGKCVYCQCKYSQRSSHFRCRYIIMASDLKVTGLLPPRAGFGRDIRRPTAGGAAGRFVGCLGTRAPLWRRTVKNSAASRLSVARGVVPGRRRRDAAGRSPAAAGTADNTAAGPTPEGRPQDGATLRS